MSTHSGGGAFWYRDSSNYQNYKDYSATVKRIEHLTSLGRQHAPSTRREQTDRLHYPDALTHYLDTCTSPTTPPSWLVIELLTAGELQRLYAGLARKYRKAIARELHLTEPVLQSWLKSYVRVRNICAITDASGTDFLAYTQQSPRAGPSAGSPTAAPSTPETQRPWKENDSTLCSSRFSQHCSPSAHTRAGRYDCKTFWKNIHVYRRMLWV